MKQLLFLAFLAIVCVCCNDSDDRYGSLKVIPTIGATYDQEDEIILMKSSSSVLDFSTFFLTLTGAESKTLNYPVDGVINGLKEGRYSVTLSSNSELPVPAFDTPYYIGNTESVVTENQTTDVPLSIKLGNAAIFFEYSQRLKESGVDYTPKVTHIAGSLKYSEANMEKKGYFPAGPVTIDISDLLTDHQLEIEAGIVYKIRLDQNSEPDGLEIIITVEAVDEPTDYWDIGAF